MSIIDRSYRHWLAVLFSALVVLPAGAQIRGISYTISPIGEQVFFGDNAGLDRGFLYGGEAGFGFGRFVELNAHYARSDRLQTSFASLSGFSDETREALQDLPPRDVSVQRYGGALQLNLPRGSVVPFATLGAGIIRFQPAHLNATRTIYLSGGGGVQFTLRGRYALRLSGVRFAYRNNMGSTFFDDLDLTDVGLGSENFNPIQVDSWAVRGALRAYVGGRTPSEETELDRALRRQLSGRLRGLSLRIEPFAASLAFHRDLAFPDDQRFAGVYAGLSLGPYVGARGFYWRAIEEGGFDAEPLHAYGGEMRFNISEARSLAPFLTFGGGYFDVREGYVGREGAEPDSEPFVIVGAGAELPINESLALNVGVRSIMMGREGGDNVRDPGQVRSSWMYSAGLHFGFGRRPAVSPDAAGGVVESELRNELQRSEARLDSLARVIARLESGPRGYLDTEVATDSAVVVAREPRLVTLPLPEEGEIYVRYGRPGGVEIETSPGSPASETVAFRQPLSSDEIESIVRETVRDELGGAATVTAEQSRDIEQLVGSRFDAMEARLQAQLDAEVARIQASGAPAETVVVNPSRSEVSVVGPALRAASPFVGTMLGRADLGVVGIRLDMDAPLLGPIHIEPEAVFGVGAGTYAYHVNLDAVYTLPYLERLAAGLRPYAGVGVGMLGFDEAPSDLPGVQITLNVRVGSEFEVSGGRLFVEYATYDFLDFQRVVGGYRFSL